MELKKKEFEEQFLQKSDIPNILFYGPFMHGKEELYQYFIRYFYNTKEIKRKYVLEVNCLNTNGIQQVKQQIHLFSMQIAKTTKDILFKTVLLRNAEFLTHDTQYSLRRDIEQYCHNTRFIILCENKKKLLPPICSRFVSIYVNVLPSYKTIRDVQTFPYYKYKQLLQTYHQLIETNAPPADFFRLAKTMYQNHFCGYDILFRFKKHDRFLEAHYLFEKYSKEYRNEVFIIFFILNVFRNKSEIQIFH
jgi:hypothetical protein